MTRMMRSVAAVFVLLVALAGPAAAAAPPDCVYSQASAVTNGYFDVAPLGSAMEDEGRAINSDYESRGVYNSSGRIQKLVIAAARYGWQWDCDEQMFVPTEAPTTSSTTSSTTTTTTAPKPSTTTTMAVWPLPSTMPTTTSTTAASTVPTAAPTVKTSKPVQTTSPSSTTVTQPGQATTTTTTGSTTAGEPTTPGTAELPSAAPASSDGGGLPLAPLAGGALAALAGGVGFTLYRRRSA